MMRKIICAALICAAVFPVSYASEISPFSDIEEGETIYFDFGETPYDGWITVNDRTKYNKDRGYGFSMISYVENESSAGGNVLSDAVKINDFGIDGVSFNVDLPDGIYEVSIYSGNIRYMSIGMEGHPAIINLENENSEGRAEIPVKDGQLNITFLKGNSGVDYSIAAMSVTRKSSLDERRRRIFICGDSLAASYYPLFMQQPLEEGYRGGWGQMLQNFISDDYYVHNMSSIGQTAKGFIESGQLDAVLAFSEPDDYVVVSYGYNDTSAYNEEEYKSYLNEIISSLQSKGCIPIICSEPASLSEFSSGEYLYNDNRYENAAHSVASENDVLYIDLHSATAKYLSSLKPESVPTLFWTQWNGEKDTLHLNRNGSGQTARIFASECAAEGLNDFAVPVDGELSEDPRLSCTKEKNTVYLQNYAPYEISVRLITNGYRAGSINESEITDITLNAYDVVEPQTPQSVYAPLYVRTNRSFIIGSGITIELSD